MSVLPEGTQIWTRSFYGFSPEEDGYVGWTEASARDRYAARLNDGDLILIYGAISAETAKAERSYVLGFVQVDTNPIRDHEKSSEVGMTRKRDAGHTRKWSEAIPIRRAWRAEEKVMIRRIAFNSYRPEAGQSLATHGTDLDVDEILQALKIKVREVSVFGEPPIAEAETKVQTFAENFKPSRAFPGSAGERTSLYEDGDTYLYLAEYTGDGHTLLGRKKAFGDKSTLLKVGVSNDPVRRREELNQGFPPAALGKWDIRLTSQAFPDKKAAEDVEALFTTRYKGKLESLGGEFFWGSRDEAEMLCWSLPGMSRF
jgi:hypothetical protein